MKYFVQIFVYSVLQHLTFIGAVTIDFNSIGYIGESIVLQCQGTPPIAVSSADWHRGGSLMDISSSRYTQTKTPTGFNLTISSLVTADGGLYHCGIAFGTSAKKSLTIIYNTSDVNITQLHPKAIEITFIAFPDPVYVVTVKEDGVQLYVNWNVSKSTQASGAIKVSLQNSTAFTNQNKIYTVHVKITSPVSLDVEKNITLVSDLTTQSISDLTTQRTDDCALKSVLGLALGVVLSISIICVICLIFIVILVKSVNIQTEDELQNLKPNDSEKTITASVRGFFISSVQWTGPHGNISTSNEKYKIKYCRNTGISTLQISALEINDSGLYICHAKGACGSSAQDSVRITVYGATDPNKYATDPNQDATDPNQGASKRILGLGFSIICVACIVCIVILVMIGKPCALKLVLGLGLGLGIPFVGCIIVIVILVKKVLKPPPTPENRKIKSGKARLV